MSEYFSDHIFDAIYSSNLKRARHTAEIIAEPHRQAVREIPALREIWMGSWEGLDWEQIGAKFSCQKDLWFAGKTKEATGGESLEEASQRTWHALNKIAQEHQKGNIVVVSHGLVIGTFICLLKEEPLLNWHDYRVSNTAFNLFLYDEKGWHIEALNQRAHLDI